MRKTVALLLAISMALACLPAMASETNGSRYYSQLMEGASVRLPETLEVLAELPSEDGKSIYLFYAMTANDKNIVVTMTRVPEYAGLTMKDLPNEEIEGWKEIFTESYPKHSKSVVVKSSAKPSHRLYRFYGMNANGTWMLSYTGVQDGLYVCVCCETDRFGYHSSEMRTIFDAFNLSFELFAMGNGVEYQPYDPEEFEVEIYNLTYDDSPDSIFRSY